MVSNEATRAVLVVDDNEANLFLLKTVLERADYIVSTAIDGTKALEMLFPDSEEDALPPFDLVLLDVMMPGIDGIQVLKEVRKTHPPEVLPVIMATAKDSSKDIVKALSLGANDYVTKPIDIQVLLARINVHVTLRRTHMELQQAQSSLITAAKMESIGRLSAGVAHEVKNPLYVLQMGVDYFHMTVDAKDESTRTTLENMQNAVDRADSIIRGMVDFSRSEELKLIESDLNELIERSLILVRHEISTRQIELVTHLADNLPPVLVDRTKIEQVIINLLTNACHAMESGGRLEVRTTYIDPDEIDSENMDRRAQVIRSFKRPVVIEVIDEGTGIPDEFMLKLFDPFFTSKPTGKGTGLGLSVTKTIIDLHGGYIDLTNTKKRGARAYICLDADGPLKKSIVEQP